MGVRGKLAAGAVVAVVLVLVFAAGAMACSCAPQAPVESLRGSDAALVGRLVKVIPHGSLRAVYRYRVGHVYKGSGEIDAGRVLNVRSARRSAACALPRRTGRNYGLFLTHAHGRWFGGICGVVSPRRLWSAATSQGGARRLRGTDSTGCPAPA